MRRTALFILCLLLIVSCSPQGENDGYAVIMHPDGHLYVGDRVSFEILPPSGEFSSEVVEVKIGDTVLGSAPFTTFGIGQRKQATLWWTWDTSGLKAGKYSLTFKLSNGPSWEEQVLLLPTALVPPPGPEAVWASTTTDCCTLYYITGTDAARDIDYLSSLADEQADLVAAQVGATLQDRIPLIFMPRVIGHGGFAWDGVYISYLYENYVGNEMELVLHHEFVHYYDNWIGGEYMPSILQEGLAVYLSGGHFKPEPIGPRAAALLELGWYIPLSDLADDFYNQQHDIGYLEAAALIQFLNLTYGPSAFIEFYRTIPYPQGISEAQVLDEAFFQMFGRSLMEMEAAFLDYLSIQPITDDIRIDLELTVAYFDAVRRYQSLLDPSAFFLTAWLPDGRAMRDMGIVADLTRRPSTWKNHLVESMLIRIHDELFSGEYDHARRSLVWTNWLLERLEP